MVFKRLASRLALSIALLALVLGGGAAYALASGSSAGPAVTTYTGCLSSIGGAVYFMRAGATPIASCRSGDSQVQWTSPAITSITAGTGVTVSGTNDVTVAVDTSGLQQRVTGTCAVGSYVTAVNADGTVACAADQDTTYSAGTGLDLTGTTFGISPGGVGTSELANDSVTAAKIANDSIVSAKVANGTIVGEGGAPGVGTATGDIALKTITNANIANGTVRGGKDATDVYGPAVANEIADGTVTSWDLAAGSVGTNALTDGAVVSPKLADASVTTAKISSNAASSTGMTTPLVLSGGQPAYTTLATTAIIPASGAVTSGKTHNVLVTGQVEFSCSTACPGSGDALVIQWQVVDGSGTAVSAPYSAQLTASLTQTFGSVSIIDASASEGAAKTYGLKVTATLSGAGTATMSLSNAVLNVVDLGRNN